MTAADDCTTCPAGSYCIVGVSEITGSCDPGFYCPAGSLDPEEEPCPPGTRRTTNGATAEADCEVCPAGFFCKGGSSSGDDCPAGAYCVAGTAVPTLCPKGTYSASLNLESQDTCSLCDPGRYCDGLGLVAPRDVCDPGFYCISGADTSRPAVDTLNLNGTLMGGPCPAGGYCPAGSNKSTPCPAGSFQNVAGARSNEDCTDCYAGYYCADSASPEATGPCAAGYYCEGAAVNPFQYVTCSEHVATHNI